MHALNNQSLRYVHLKFVWCSFTGIFARRKQEIVCSLFLLGMWQLTLSWPTSTEWGQKRIRLSRVKIKVKVDLQPHYSHCSVAGIRCVYFLVHVAGASAAALPADVPPLTIDGKPHLPFQLQIEYTAQDGSRNRRVITDAKPTTKERGVAERGTCV